MSIGCLARLTEQSCILRQNSLLADPNLVGWALEGPGISRAMRQIEVVTSTNSTGPGTLKNALDLPSRWVCFAPELDGAVINTDGRNFDMGLDTVLDGRDAAVTVQQTEAGKTMFILNNGGNVIHNLELRGFGTAAGDGGGLRCRQGENFWIDQLTCTNMDDDALNVGFSNNASSARYVTISRYKVVNSDKGLLLSGDSKVSQEAERCRFVSIHTSLLGAKDRGFRNSGFRDVHAWDCVVEKVSFGATVADHSANNNGAGVNNNGTRDASSFIESFVYRAPGAANRVAQFGNTRLTSTNGVPDFTTENRIYWTSQAGRDSDYGTYTPHGGNHTDLATSTERSTFDEPPYEYSARPKNQVAAAVDAQAGAQPVSLSFLDNLCVQDRKA